MASNKGLGRGLGALLGDFEEPKTQQSPYQLLPIHKVEPNPHQPRRDFDEEELAALADSIATHGILQPLTVRELPSGYFQIIAGERRWRAARMASLREVPAVVIEADDRKVQELALIENLQRQDLNAVEEALGYQSLMAEYGMTQEEAASRVGKSRPAVANSLRLLQLDSRVRNFVVENKLTGGHARTLLPVTDGDDQFELAEMVIDEGLSVRAVEAMVKAYLQKAEKPAEKEEISKEDAREYRAIEDDLKSLFATKVKVKPLGKRNKGKIEIEYYSDDDLERLLALLKK